MLTDVKTLWDKRIEQLADAWFETPEGQAVFSNESFYGAFSGGFHAGLEEAKKMFSSAQFSKKTKQIVRYGKEWRFKS